MLIGKPAAALVAIAALAGCAGRQTLQTSFDHSEWHPSSMLRLDVASGGFVAEFRDGTLANGRFSADETGRIQALLAAAQSTGFTDPLCGRDGKDHPLRIVVSNGGQQTLVLDRGGERLVAPENEACWTDEAQALHSFIEHTLDTRGDDWSMPRQRLRFGVAG
jgi:hypothetical protein